MSRTLVRRATELLDRPISRRGFLRRLTYGATALSVAPVAYALRPGTAYAQICSCSGQSCSCSSTCCDGYTEFCCTITGQNVCPAGTIPAGWWKADGAGVCDNASGAQPRYYLDCNVSDCGGCGCGGGGVCSGSCQNPQTFTCGCALGDCSHRKASCTLFRYGQCNQQIQCVGPIVCRVVTCTPPWLWDSSCQSSPVLTDNNTRFHNAPCLTDTSALPVGGVPVVGDWTGAGRMMHGKYINGMWYLSPAGGGPLIIFRFGQTGDRPVVGDWNGDGRHTVGYVRHGEWFIRNSNSAGPPDHSFWFGNPGDIPFAGDWTGGGVDLPGLHRPSDGRVYIRNSQTTGIADVDFFFGNPGDVALAGDFDGDGVDTVSLYRPSQQRFYIINRLGSNQQGLGAADYWYQYGNPGDVPLVGDWNGNGTDSPGVFRNGVFYLRNSNSAGAAHLQLT
jgi:hypothetical protein